MVIQAFTRQFHARLARLLLLLVMTCLLLL